MAKTQTRKIEPGEFKRASVIEEKSFDKETRILSFSFSSEKPVRRWYGYEILSHESPNIDLSSIRAGAPLLRQHDPDKHIGTIIDAFVREDRKGAGQAKLSRNAIAEERDIEDGILRSISVGYETIKIIKEEETDEGERVITWAWKPREISLVSMPADDSVGVGRSQIIPDNPEQEIRKMEENKQVNAPAGEVRAQEVKVDVDAIRKEEQKRSAEITAYGRKHGMQEAAEKAIADGTSVDSFRASILEVIEKRGTAAPVKSESPLIGMSEREVKKFSFMRAIQSMIPGSTVDAGFEREVSQEAAKKFRKEARGILVPYDVLVSDNRAFSISGGTGAYAVATNLLAGSFIEALRNKQAVNALGATYLTGLVGDVAIPKKTGTTTAYWVAEATAPTTSQPTLGQITGTPHTVGAYTDITRKLMMQSSLDVEMMVRDDIATTLALAMDYAVFNGTGSDGQPLKISGVSGVNNPTISVAGTPTRAEILAFLSDIMSDNADIGVMKWAMSPAVMAVLANTVEYKEVVLNQAATENVGGMSAGGFMLDMATKRMLGYDSVVSNQVGSKALWFGVWSQLVVAMWGALDLTVDPYSLSTTGGVRVVGLQDMDVMVRNAQSFAYNVAVSA